MIPADDVLTDALTRAVDRETILADYPPERTVARPGGGNWTRRKGQASPKIRVYRQVDGVLVTHTHRLDLARSLAEYQQPDQPWGEPTTLWVRRHLGDPGATGAPILERLPDTVHSTFPAVLVPFGVAS